MLPRVVEPELLDRLPPDDPEAVRSRRDLRLLNGLMANTRWFTAQAAQVPRGLTWLELGAGDGSLSRTLAPFVLAAGGRYAAVDLAPAPKELPTGMRWIQGDLRAPEVWAGVDVVVANLILHHFDDVALTLLAHLFRATRLVLACEPARHAFHSVCLHALHPLIGPVTRHDGQVSIRAGFRGNELPHLLRLESEQGWSTHTSHSILGAYRLRAKRGL